MDFSNSIIVLLLVSLLCPGYSSEISSHQITDQNFRPVTKFHKLKMITNRLRRINKHAVKTIQSPDGDIIDCIESDKQPAFDHPLLKGQKPLNPPKSPIDHNQTDILSGNFQLWSLSGESCPENTIPIVRTRKEDILRASSIKKFGRKINHVNSKTTSEGHAHATASVNGEFYGAKTNINVWHPQVEGPNEFSLAQIWLASGQSDQGKLNTIEAGWQVNQEINGDNFPRLFVYWTADEYNQTGCYNLECSGFVQTSNKVAIGASLSPISTYNGQQFEITLAVWKAPSGDWWLEYGTHGTLIGYWPSSLFTFLKGNAKNIQFGGEIFNSKSTGSYTSTQMGSGHFAEEGFQKASYFRNMQVMGSDSIMVPLSNVKYFAEQPNCYNIQGGINDDWGNYFYYGGPGRNEKCP